MKRTIPAATKAKAARLGVEIRRVGEGRFLLLYHGRQLRRRVLCADDICFWLDVWEHKQTDLTRWKEPDWLNPPGGPDKNFYWGEE